MFTTAALISLVVISVVYYFQRYRRWRERYAGFMELPGPPTYPLIGNVWKLMLVPRLERLKYMQDIRAKYGLVFKMWNGSHPIVICSSAEDAETILSSRVNIEKSSSYDFLIPWLGTGLLISSGSKWHRRRKLLTPTFHFSILESFLPIMSEHSRTFIEKLKCMESEEKEWNIFPYVHRFTLDVICETAMGLKMDIQNSETPEYLTTVLSMSNIVMQKVLKPWWHNKFLYSCSNLYKKEMRALKILHEMSMNVIREKREERQIRKQVDAENDQQDCNRERRKAFLDLLLDIAEDTEVPLTDEDIREEVDTFMFAGHDTTTSGILSTIHFLSAHPDIQDKVAEELFSVFGDSDREPTLYDLSELKYLECVIKESRRLLPPAPVIFRQLSEPVTLASGHVIPTGTHVQVSIFGIHHHKKYFSNPEEFDPDNFTLENARSRHPYSFIPFSAGPRNCIGQKFAILEEKVLLSALLRNFKITTSQKTIQDLGLYFEIVLRHENGIRVNIVPRVW